MLLCSKLLNVFLPELNFTINCGSIRCRLSKKKQISIRLSCSLPFFTRVSANYNEKV